MYTSMLASPHHHSRLFLVASHHSARAQSGNGRRNLIASLLCGEFTLGRKDIRCRRYGWRNRSPPLERRTMHMEDFYDGLSSSLAKEHRHNNRMYRGNHHHPPCHNGGIFPVSNFLFDRFSSHDGQFRRHKRGIPLRDD